MRTFTNYFEANQFAFDEYNKVKVGDKVTAMGITTTIAEIYYLEVYTETGHPMFREAKDEDTYYIFYDIEFKDADGNYRHWKSSYDGGALKHTITETRVVGHNLEETEYITDNEGVTEKKIVRRRYHCGRVLWEKTNLWNSRDGYTHKEF